MGAAGGSGGVRKGGWRWQGGSRGKWGSHKGGWQGVGVAVAGEWVGGGREGMAGRGVKRGGERIKISSQKRRRENKNQYNFLL